MAIEVRGSAPLLGVFDVARSIAFYRDALGFEIVQTSGPDYRFGWALLKLGNTELMVNGTYEGEARPSTPDPARVAAHADTSIYFGCPDLQAAYAELRTRGVDVEPPAMTTYGFRSILVRDPDGYALVFHWPATQEAYDVWVARYGLEPMTIAIDEAPAAD